MANLLCALASFEFFRSERSMFSTFYALNMFDFLRTKHKNNLFKHCFFYYFVSEPEIWRKLFYKKILHSIISAYFPN